MILVDTGVWIYYFRAASSPEINRLVRAIESGDDICITGIILAEILQGVRSEEENRRVKRTLDLFIFLPMAKHSYELAAKIYRDCRGSGDTVGSTIDCLIAACAIEHRAELLHSDGDYIRIARHSPLKLVA